MVPQAQLLAERKMAFHCFEVMRVVALFWALQLVDHSKRLVAFYKKHIFNYFFSCFRDICQKYLWKIWGYCKKSLQAFNLSVSILKFSSAINYHYT